MDRRGERRTRRRLPCDLWAAGRRHSAVVLNLGARGLFVQTRAQPRPGTEVEVRIRAGSLSEPVVLRACVARVYAVPPELVAVAGGGVGLRIQWAPTSYLSLLRSVTPRAWLEAQAAASRGGQAERAARAAEAEHDPQGAAGPPLRRFRVRVCEADGSRPFTLLIGSASEAEATQDVLEELGPGWKIEGLEEL